MIKCGFHDGREQKIYPWNVFWGISLKSNMQNFFIFVLFLSSALVQDVGITFLNSNLEGAKFTICWFPGSWLSLCDIYISIYQYSISLCGNIDFVSILASFNVKPVTGVNFSLISTGEDWLITGWIKVWSPKSKLCIEICLNVNLL